VVLGQGVEGTPQPDGEAAGPVGTRSLRVAISTATYRISGSGETRRTAPLAPARPRQATAVRRPGHVRDGAEQAWKWREAQHQSLRVPALALTRMIEHMGGAEASFARGAYVNLTV